MPPLADIETDAGCRRDLKSIYQFSCGATFATEVPQSKKNANTAGGETAKPIVPRNPTTVNQSPFSMAF